MVNSSKFGRSVVLSLKFKTDEGVDSRKIKRGTWVIAYGEIPMRKLNDDKFMIYPDCRPEDLERLENQHNKDLPRLYVPELKSSSTSKKRGKYWESSKYF